MTPTAVANQPPDLTERLNAVIDRLESARIGSFTFAEFQMLQSYLKHPRNQGPFRVHDAYEGIPGRRNPEAELTRVLVLEQMAVKAGV